MNPDQQILENLVRTIAQQLDEAHAGAQCAWRGTVHWHAIQRDDPDAPLTIALEGIAGRLRVDEQADWMASSSGTAVEIAAAWLANGFDPAHIADWLAAGCLRPEIARALLNVGVSPEQMTVGEGAVTHIEESGQRSRIIPRLFKDTVARLTTTEHVYRVHIQWDSAAWRIELEGFGTSNVRSFSDAGDRARQMVEAQLTDQSVPVWLIADVRLPPKVQAGLDRIERLCSLLDETALQPANQSALRRIERELRTATNELTALGVSANDLNSLLDTTSTIDRTANDAE